MIKTRKWESRRQSSFVDKASDKQFCWKEMKSSRIRRCTEADIEAMFSVINDAARAYKGVIPDDRWHDPYMPMEELQGEMADGVEFWGYEIDGHLIGVMGIQDKGDVDLIRHAYVRTTCRRQGIGAMLLNHLRGLSTRSVLIGTWLSATWAVSFYQKHGFRVLTREETERLLRRYWKIPTRQVETSVVLASEDFFLHPDPRVGKKTQFAS